MLKSGKYVVEGSWVAPPSGGFVDFQVSSAWMLSLLRPQQVTLPHVRMLFYGWHRQPTQRRYFDPGLTAVLSAVPEDVHPGCEVWYQHAEEPDLMRAACCELRNRMEEQHLGFEDAGRVDGFFAAHAPEVIDRLYANGSFAQPAPMFMGPPGMVVAGDAGEEAAEDDHHAVPVAMLASPQGCEEAGGEAVGVEWDMHFPDNVALGGTTPSCTGIARLGLPSRR